MTHMIVEKRCSTCKTTQPATNFGKCSRSKDGLKGQCKSCKSKSGQAYYARTKRSPEHKPFLKVPHLNRSEITRLFGRIRIDQSIQWDGTACWIWMGATYKEGYGRTVWRREEVLTHRLTYAWLVSPLPTRKPGEKTPNLDHLCRNTACCNPVHLEFVAPKVNILRSNSLVANNARKSHCKYGHEFNPENTIWVTPTHRSCRTCRQEKAKRQREAPNYKEKMVAYQAKYFTKLGQEARRARWRATYYRLKERKLTNSRSGSNNLTS